MARGIVAYGAYVPYWRLQRAAIGAALGSGGGKGTRAVASYDEDSTSMGVEAARLAMRSAPGDVTPGVVLFSTASPPYLDKTNANAIHAALGLDASVMTGDVGGAVRSGLIPMALGNAASYPVLAVTADIRTGLPGGADERDGGDGSAAFLWADHDDVIAELVTFTCATDEFLDRWRLPGEPASHVWEERFGEQVYVPLADQAINDALKAAGVTADELDHVVVTGVHSRAARSVAKRIGARPDAYAPGPRRGHRQHRHGPPRHRARRGARPRPAGTARDARPARGRRIGRRAPHHRRNRRLPRAGGEHGRVADRIGS